MAKDMRGSAPGKKKKRRLTRADRILLTLSLVLIFGAAAMIGYASLMNWTPSLLNLRNRVVK